MHTFCIELNRRLCFFQLDFAFLSPLGAAWKPAKSEIAHALGRAHEVSGAVFLDIELTGTRLQHISAKIAFSLFHFFSPYGLLTW